jgi:hypothetical protein
MSSVGRFHSNALILQEWNECSATTIAFAHWLP